MAKDKTIYTCTECGGTTPKWLGKCPHCDAWNTLIESAAESAAPAQKPVRLAGQNLPKSPPLADIEATDMAAHAHRP